MPRPLAFVALLAACGSGYRSVRVVDEEPAGTCARTKLAPGESCEQGARDYSAGATLIAPKGHAGELGGAAWFRWPLFDVSLDERRMRRDDGRSYRSLAGGVGTHLRPMMFFPRVQRYVDLVVNFGFELGGVYQEKLLRGRGDAYVGTALDVFAPDIGPMRYLCCGVPGIRIGVRYTAFVQGWQGDTTFELGLVWRWGVPVDLYHHWTTQRSGD